MELSSLRENNPKSSCTESHTLKTQNISNLVRRSFLLLFFLTDRVLWSSLVHQPVPCWWSYAHLYQFVCFRANNCEDFAGIYYSRARVAHNGVVSSVITGYYSTFTTVKQFFKKDGLHLINQILQTLHSFDNTYFEGCNYADVTFMILFQPCFFNHFIFSTFFTLINLFDHHKPISDSLPVKALLTHISL